MKAHAESLLALFDSKMQYEVPLFQRQYVWKQDRHWEPLWEDIARKFTDFLEGRKDAPVHFLGAMVLDQKQTPATQVGKRQVIDGQQRLTTFQIFLSAFRDFCYANGCEELGADCAEFTTNTGRLRNAEVDKYKVYPTQLDRGQFKDVVDAGSKAELSKRYPLKKRPRARKYDPRPRMIEAYFFFYEQIEAYFLGSLGEKPLKHEAPLATRTEECFQALKDALQVVEIDLEPGDDAQVIFETLNARGEPLLPADLLRNYIFLRAGRRNEPQEKLYADYWSQFDAEFWRQEVQQGRLLRPRSDLFLQHFLACRITTDIPIKNLFVEYKHWMEKARPFATVEEELACLKRQGEDFRQIIAPKKDEPLYELGTFLEAFDVRTCYPLLLAMFDVGFTEAQWSETSTILESYLLRRFVCGLTTQNYNRTFLTLTKTLRRDGFTPSNLASELLFMGGDSVIWPSDAAFAQAWNSIHAYHVLNNPKIVHIMKRLSKTFASTKNEEITIGGSLTIEHILPQTWQPHWPLQDGSPGMTLKELFDAPQDDPRAQATRRRNAAIQTIGNLTILTQALNSEQSNALWSTKRPNLLAHSLLPINLNLSSVEVWDEAAISKRSADLFVRALKIWPRPELEI